ncbi:MAG: hypothetical protein WCV90_06690 [Candidatus Woesearchaeota archaeon]
MDPQEYQKLLEKYKAKVRDEFGPNAEAQPKKITSKEYSEFKSELYPTSYTLYEKVCNYCGNILKLGVSEKKAIEMQKDLDICHLNTTPSGVVSFSILASLVVMVLGSLLMFSLPMLLFGLKEPMYFLVFFCVIAGLIMIPALRSIPKFMANTWRMKASNQMVQSVFYMVTYMRHTSNFERAIEFASDHLDPPLSLDFRKIMWDVETQKYSNIRDSANAYLSTWEESNKDFVEAFHLIESSLFEGSEERRLSLLDKALDVILNGTYENMLHYAHSLSSPITMLHMLGIILPILGLVILPLVVSFMGSGGSPFVSAIYIALLYNISLPLIVYYLGKTILSKRPAGYGAVEVSSSNDKMVNLSLGKKLMIKVVPLYVALMIIIVGFIIGFSPLLIHAVNPTFEIKDEAGKFKMMDYVCQPCDAEGTMPAGSCGPECDVNQRLGPFGVGATVLSLVFIAALGFGLGTYFSLRSKNVTQIREQTRALEDEFSSALFQLGNRLGDGLPAEIAFSKVAQNMQGTNSGEFFSLAERNMTKLGMGLEQAIFDPKVGALTSYPSKVIESSMKVLVESAKKGPLIAAQALLSMSRYIKEIHTVDERLKDLMAEVLSSMNSQIKFLTPAIAGIVVGITSMISTILTKLSAQLATFSQNGDQGMMGGMLSIFGIGIPTFHFQIVVGVYIVEIAYILTILANGIDNGADKLAERYALGKNLVRSTLLYSFIAIVVVILFNVFAAGILSNALGG